jgi:hypothetical protein
MKQLLLLLVFLSGCENSCVFDTEVVSQAQTEVFRDGFDKSSVVLDSKFSGQMRGDLVIGACTFPMVWIYQESGDQRYIIEALGAGEGKYHTTGASVEVTNADELLNILTDLHCTKDMS